MFRKHPMSGKINESYSPLFKEFKQKHLLMNKEFFSLLC